MKQYRKKPVVIEAMQLLNNDRSILACQRFIDGNFDISHPMASDYWDMYSNKVKEDGGIRLKTLESDNETQLASFGDYIIKGIKGEFYPCKPDIFEATYEPVND